MKRLLSSAAAAALISAASAGLMLGKAAAADLTVAPPVVAPLPVPHNWTGFYVGLHAGYGWANAEGDDDDFDGDGDIDLFEDADLDGGLIGAQLGYNYQWNWLVLGVEADATWSFIGSDDDFFDDDDDDFDRIGLEADVDWLASIRGRVGAAFDRFLVYGTGGVAFTQVSHDFDDDEDFFDDEDNGDGTEVGWVLGLGAEYLFTDNISVGAEYLHYEFNDVGELTIGDFSGDIDGDVDVIRARVNVKFNSLFGG
jgi:outer membrane immunogenic protein